MPAFSMVPGQRKKINFTPFELTVLSSLGGMPANNVYFVQSTHANANNNAGAGTKEQPLATLDYAVGLCTASKGDVIIALPGHVETITAAAGLDLDVAGITLLGLGQGRNRPTINFTTATTADMDVDAANITVANFYIKLTSVDALAAPIDVNATDFSLIGCEVECADATYQATLALLTDANASRLTVEDCLFHGTADAGMAAAVRIVGGAGHRIVNNDFIGAYTTTIGAIENVTTACTETYVLDNRIRSLTASSAKAMVFVTGATGQISRNYMQVLTGTAPIAGDAMSWVGANYYSAVIAQLGVLI